MVKSRDKQLYPIPVTKLVAGSDGYVLKSSSGIPTWMVNDTSSASSASQQVDAVSSAPGWTVCGGFFTSKTSTIYLDVIGSVSDATLTMTFRLYDITTGSVGIVSGSTVSSITSTVDTRAVSGSFSVIANHQYQIQCQVVGNVGIDFFGTVQRVAPTAV